jgi:hypothetical protein
MRGTTDLGSPAGQASATTATGRRPIPWRRRVAWKIHPCRWRGSKSFVDDLGLGRGVVLSRAATTLRSLETQPIDRRICPLPDGPVSP